MLPNPATLIMTPEGLKHDLATRLSRIRLSRNITQEDLALKAGVSTSSVKRLEAGENTSLDVFIGVIIALRLGDHLATALPDPDIRPLERVKLRGHERRRARHHPPAPPTNKLPWKVEQE
jgi:transcriptional regulator with XRE-family HTH domain